MGHHRADGQAAADRPTVESDDALLDLFGDVGNTPSQRELVDVLAAKRREVDADSDRVLIDSDTALAAMSDVGRPFAAGVALLVVVMMIGATLGVVLSYVVTGWVSGALAAVALPATCWLLAAGVVAYRERR